MGRSRPLALFVGAALSIIACAAQASQSIAFVRDANVWTMLSDGSEQRQLTHNGGCAHPSWSPRGDFLVFEQNATITKLRLVDGQVQRLTKSGDAYQPAWRPRTTEVWYVRLGKPDAEGVRPAWLWALETRTGSARRVAAIKTDLAYGPERTDWRPDGQMLVVNLEEAGDGGSIYFLDALGRKVSVDLEGINQRWPTWADAHVAWSPTNPVQVALAKLYREWDATKLPSEFAWSLVRMDLSSRTETPLYDADHPVDPSGDRIMMVQWPTWSPDAGQIAFCLSTWGGGKRPRILAIDMGTRTTRTLANDAIQPAWSPQLP